MNAGQYEGILGRLDAILAKMPAAPVTVIPAPALFTVHHLDGSKTTTPTGPTGPVLTTLAKPQTLLQEGKEGASLALYCLLVNLDGWISGAKGNHQSGEHRGENTGEECWRQYAPSDIRSMVNDVARELGLAEFPMPITPEEDQPL
jgi:hypothetical protein